MNRLTTAPKAVRPIRQSCQWLMEGLEQRTLLSATLLKDINASGIGTSSLPEQFNVVGNQVLFLAYDTTRGQMLWATNGTASGTTIVKDLNANPQTGAFAGFGGDSIVINNQLYFTGIDSTHGVELWKSDGTSNATQIVADLDSGTDGSYPAGFVNFNGKLAFQAMGNLYVTDGTASGTINLGNDSPLGTGGTTDRMTVMGNKLYFMRYGTSNPDGHSTGELWQSDGTINGTKIVTDVSPGNDGQDGINSVSSNLITIGSEMYFAADDGTHGWELWKSDGTAANTSMVADLAPPSDPSLPVIDGSYPTNLTNLNGTLYFTASPTGLSTQLYRLDPTTHQPVIVRPAANGDPASAQQLTPSGNELFFTATDTTHGSELWRTDGTSAGTFMVKDINAGGADSLINNLTDVGGKVYFTTDDGTHGAELWTSDGTASGTALAVDIEPGSNASSPGPVTAFHGELIFAAAQQQTGREPYGFTPTPPAAPVGVLAVSGSKGVSRSPFPVMVGTAPAGSTVHLFADGVQIGSTTAAGDGSYRVTSSVRLKDGKHVLHTSDSLGGQSSVSSAPVSFTVDTTSPGVKITATSPTEIDVKFSENVSASFARTDFSLIDIATGQRISSSYVRVSYNRNKNTAAITFKHLPAGLLTKGHYRLTFTSSRVNDVAGNHLAASSFAFTVLKKKR